jgi:hypothetical protein
MPNPIPGDADLMFIEAVATGTVHIAVRYDPHHVANDEVIGTVSGGAAFIDLLLAPTVTRCGKRTFPQFQEAHLKTSRFSDEQLCAACYRTLTAEDQERAFEHDQPEGAEEDPDPALTAA